MNNFIKKNSVIFFLLGIFLLAASLRFYKLSEFPVGFHIDEAILGYTAYSLILTGKDTNNNFYPMYTEVFGDNLPTGYHILTMLPVKLFGLTELATRFVGAFFGSITVFAVFFLAFSIFRDKKISLLTALLVALSPWHVSLSRGSSEAEVALFFIILGFACVIHSFNIQQKKYLLYGTVGLLVSYFFYHTPRIFVPILYGSLMLVFFYWGKIIKQYKVWLLGSFFIIGMSALLLVFVLPGGSSRFNQISIFSFPETKLVMEEQIREDGVMGAQTLLTRVFHNKVISYFLTFTSNYFDYFTANFLFIKGGLPAIFTVPQMGLVYIVELPFFIFGFVLLSISKKTLYKTPLVWLLLSPVVASFTVDDIPNIRRAAVMIPAIEMIVAYGFFNVIKDSFWKKTITYVWVIFLLLNFFYFLHQYFFHQPIHRNWYRNDGFAQMIKTIKNSYTSVDKIIVTKNAGGIYPLVLFYMQYDPRMYQTEGSPKDHDYKGFGKFIFVPQACPFHQKHEYFPKGYKVIYIEKGECATNAQNEKAIFRKDGIKEFNLVYQ